MEFGHWDVRKIVERGGDDLKNFDKYIRQAAYRAIKSISARYDFYILTPMQISGRLVWTNFIHDSILDLPLNVQ